MAENQATADRPDLIRITNPGNGFPVRMTDRQEITRAEDLNLRIRSAENGRMTNRHIQTGLPARHGSRAAGYVMTQHRGRRAVRRTGSRHPPGPNQTTAGKIIRQAQQGQKREAARNSGTGKAGQRKTDGKGSLPPAARPCFGPFLTLSALSFPAPAGGTVSHRWRSGT